MKMNLKKDLNEKDLPFYVATPIFNQLRLGYKKVTEGDQDRIYVITGREGLDFRNISEKGMQIYPGNATGLCC